MLTEFELRALWVSVKVALSATLALTPVGLGLGYLLARRQFAGKTLLEHLIYTPLVLPPVVTGYLLLTLLGPQGPVGRWLLEPLGIAVVLSPLGAVLAAAVVALPLFVQAVRAGFELIDPKLEEAARTLGAGEWRIFRQISLPLAWPAFGAGLVLAFTRALGEFGATITLAGNMPGVSQTIPLAIYQKLQVPGGEAQAWRLALLCVIVAFAALFGAGRLKRHLANQVKP